MRFGATAVVALFYTVFGYALCAHWNFGKGWLNGLGFKDFAGCGTISLVGGIAALVTCILLKPRANRFGLDNYPRSYNPPYVAFGTLLVMILLFNSLDSCWMGLLDQRICDQGRQRLARARIGAHEHDFGRCRRIPRCFFAELLQR